MIVSVNSHSKNDSNGNGRQSLWARPSRDYNERSSRTLTIGLLNNMPDAALEATERQFTSLLDSASGDVPVRLLLFALPGVPRSESVAAHISKWYAGTDEMMSEQLDGLIVTGREPLSPRLQDEPYWGSFTQVVDWARDHTISTVWSCLAAHAAVLYMHGIERVRSDRKHYGLFDCTRVSDHYLTAKAGARFRLPHSRWNGLDERELIRHGYRVLTHSALAGVDTFIRENGSLFVFFQGHPEYEASTLLLEYRRDVSRYLRGESPGYPNLPFNYFDSETVTALNELRREARLFAREELMPQVSAVLDAAPVERAWETTATSLYRAWIDHICSEKRLLLAVDGRQTVATEPEISRPIPPSPTLTGELQAPRTAATASARMSTIL